MKTQDNRLVKGVYTDLYIKQALIGLQFLDEIGGPDTCTEYIYVLKQVAQEIEERISNAQAMIDSGDAT